MSLHCLFPAGFTIFTALMVSIPDQVSGSTQLSTGNFQGGVKNAPPVLTYDGYIYIYIILIHIDIKVYGLVSTDQSYHHIY